jgi:hypothetical protein
MWRALLLIVLVTTADAKPAKKPTPPTKAQLAAIQLATDWLAELPTNTAKLTGKPFFAVIYADEGTPCPPSDNVTCLRDKLAAKGKPHLWRHTLGGPLVAQTKKLDDKAAIVVELDEGCDGTDNQTLIVVKNKKVTAVMAQTATCSE